MLTNKKKNNKLKLIICSALAFIVGAFTLATLPQRNYVVLAEELPGEQQEEVHSDIVSETLLSIAKQGVANGEITSYDYFDLDNKENFPYDEDVILINANNEFVQIGNNLQSKIFTFGFYWFYDGDDGLVRTTNSFTLSESSVGKYIRIALSYAYDYMKPISHYNYYVDYAKYNNNYNLYTEGTYFFEGSIFKFYSSFYDYIQLLYDGYSAEEIQDLGGGFAGSNKYIYKSGSNYSSKFYYSSDLNFEIYNSITFEVVKLSDLLVYAYNNGYDLGIENSYNEGYQDGYNQGEQDGYNQGEQDGYQDGYNEGEQVGYEDGYQSGYNEGEQVGYEDGYQDGNALTNDYLEFGVFANSEQEFVFDYYTDSLPDEPYEDYQQPARDYTPYLNGGYLEFSKINNINLYDYQYAHFINGDWFIGQSAGYTTYYFDNFETTIYLNIPMNYSEPFIQFTGAYCDYLYEIKMLIVTPDGFNRRVNGGFDSDYNLVYVDDFGNMIGNGGINGTLKEIYFMCGEFNPDTSKAITPELILRDLKIRDTSRRNHLPSYNTGFNEGEQVGYDNGYNQGVADGYEDGYRQGEIDGYAEGVEVQGGLFQSFFGSIIDVPLKTFYSLFNIDIFGINLSGFLLSLFSICMIVALIRFFV